MEPTKRFITARQELAELEKQLVPLLKKRSEAQQECDRLESLEFIKANKITRADVQGSNGDKVPHFFTANKFGDWLANQTPLKRWAEWNGIIYHTVDLINNRMPEMPARYSDLKE